MSGKQQTDYDQTESRGEISAQISTDQPHDDQSQHYTTVPLESDLRQTTAMNAAEPSTANQSTSSATTHKLANQTLPGARTIRDDDTDEHRRAVLRSTPISFDFALSSSDITAALAHLVQLRWGYNTGQRRARTDSGDEEDIDNSAPARKRRRHDDARPGSLYTFSTSFNEAILEPTQAVPAGQGAAQFPFTVHVHIVRNTTTADHDAQSPRHSVARSSAQPPDGGANGSTGPEHTRRCSAATSHAADILNAVVDDTPSEPESAPTQQSNTHHVNETQQGAPVFGHPLPESFTDRLPAGYRDARTSMPSMEIFDAKSIDGTTTRRQQKKTKGPAWDYEEVDKIADGKELAKRVDINDNNVIGRRTRRGGSTAPPTASTTSRLTATKMSTTTKPSRQGDETVEQTDDGSAKQTNGGSRKHGKGKSLKKEDKHLSTFPEEPLLDPGRTGIGRAIAKNAINTNKGQRSRKARANSRAIREATPGPPDSSQSDPDEEEDDTSGNNKVANEQKDEIDSAEENITVQSRVERQSGGFTAINGQRRHHHHQRVETQQERQQVQATEKAEQDELYE